MLGKVNSMYLLIEVRCGGEAGVIIPSCLVLISYTEVIYLSNYYFFIFFICFLFLFLPITLLFFFEDKNQHSQYN